MTLYETIQLRRGTAALWASVNPVLAQGEEGHETDTGKRKVGDGATAWNSLPYWGGGGAGAVSTVFGRAGAVAAQAGDYTAAQVGADASGLAAAAQAASLPLPSGTPSPGQVPVATGTGEASAWGTAAGGSGTVTGMSVVTANGLAGTVANPATTPAVTLSTTVSGLLKGNGTAVTAAAAGTDYLAPNGSGAALTGITAAQVSADAAGAAAAAQAAAVAAAEAASALRANNLSDLASASAARANLGLGSAATQASSAFTEPRGTGTQQLKLAYFSLDSYTGADPTGAAVSDAAWTAAYADAVAAVQSSGGVYGGAMIAAGAGLYQFSSNAVKISDPRIGFTGQGVGVTYLFSKGSSGDVVWATDTAWGTYSALGAAPIGDFTISGAQCAGPMNGLHYGDRAGARNRPVRCESFSFSAASRAFWFRNDNGGLIERTTNWALETVTCANSFVFDGNNNTHDSVPTSSDYTSWDLTLVTGSAIAANVTGIQVVNNADVVGSHIRLRGNIAAQTGFNATLIQVGSGAGDYSKIAATTLDVAVEADAGTVYDVVVNTVAGYGVLNTTGKLWLINGGVSFTAGSITGGVVKFAGMGSAPLMVSANGTVYQIGPDLMSFDSANGKATLGNALVFDGRTGHLIQGAGGGTPGVAVSAGAGTGATVSIIGNDVAGVITLTTGTASTAGGTQVTVTFANAGGAAAYVWLAPVTSNLTGGSPGFFAPAPGGGATFTVNAAGTPVISTVYTFRYFVIFTG